MSQQLHLQHQQLLCVSSLKIHYLFSVCKTIDIGLLFIVIIFSAPQTLMGCNFENNNICRWSQDVTDKFNWTLHKGSSSSSDTGPSTDHTTGNSTSPYL